MKTLLASALAATVLLSGVAAQAATQQHVSPDINFILPNADLSGLSNRQIAAINSVLYSDNTRLSKESQIRAILN